MPVFFFARRIVLLFIILVTKDYLWIQLASLNFMTLSSVMFTLWYLPYETKQANYSEVFNDCTHLLLIYCLFCFTDFVGEAETREDVGFVFIGIDLANLAINLMIMIGISIIKAKLYCKRRLAMKKMKIGV